MYTIFHRTWWKVNPSWPNGIEPCIGHKTLICRDVPTIEEARKICARWNATAPEARTREAKKLSRKAEFEQQ